MEYQLVKSADKYSLTVVCWTGRIYEKKEIQLYIDTGKKWIDKKVKIFENRNKKANCIRLFYIFNWICWQNQNKWYIWIVKFTVEKLLVVESEISYLEQSQKDLLKIEYEKIEQQGIEFVKVKHIQKKIFEIKSNELRFLFKYKEGKIIVIRVVFVKKTQKTPKEMIKLAEKRLKEVWLWNIYM